MLNTVERARGRWREILPRLGIETGFLTNRHGPCPLCGGRDRYRFDDRDGTGSYFCGQCGPGVGIILVRKRNKWDHATACAEVDRIIGDGAPITAAAPTRAAKPEGSRAAAIERLLREATDHNVVEAYLAKRGITTRSPVLQGIRACPYFDEKGRLIGRFPAVVAPIVGPDGVLQSAQRIYIADVEPRKKAMPPVGTINGAAVRLHTPVDGALGVAEGIETSLGAYELFGIPTWAALTENGVKTFVPAASTKTLHIFADNDSNFVGQDAAYSLARRLSRDGLTVKVRVPPVADTDWLDVLNSRTQT